MFNFYDKQMEDSILISRITVGNNTIFAILPHRGKSSLAYKLTARQF